LPGIHAVFLRPVVVGSRLVLFGDGVEDEKTEVVGFLLEFEQFRKLLSGDELALLDLGRDDENGGSRGPLGRPANAASSPATSPPSSSTAIKGKKKMEFKSLGNIETSFRQIRLYAFVFAIVCVAVSGYAVYASYSFAKEQREKIYVLDQGKSLMLALSQDASRNRPVEAREHVRRFHELFFTIAPDKDAIEKNMERAFVLCDKSAFNYYKDLAEKGYYNRAISGNVNQRIEVDSIHCNFNTYPYAVTTYAREFIVRQSNVTERSLVTTCTLQNSVRSDNNPQGFLMENFLVKENRDIQTYKR